MSKYTRTQKILWGALLMTEAVKPEELELLGLHEDQAKYYAFCLSQFMRENNESEDKSKHNKLVISLKDYKFFGVLTDDPKETILL